MTQQRTAHSQRRHRSLALVAMTVVAAGGLVACSSSSGSDFAPATQPASAAPSASASPTASASVSTGALAPLTGTRVSSTAARRPVVAADVSGSTTGVPPTGLDTADIVYAEYVEGSGVRLISLYQSRGAGRVGPITSTRPTDPKLLRVLKGCLAYSGGTAGFITQVTAAGLCPLTPTGNPSGFSSSGSSQYANVSTLFGSIKDRSAPPTTSLFATSGQPLGSGRKTAHTLTITLAGGRTAVWTYSSSAKRWRSSVNGTTVSVATVQVLITPYRTLAVHHPAATITSAAVTGAGQAAIVSGPVGVAGTWYRRSANQLGNIVDADKRAVRPLPGSSWVVLAPTGSTYRFS